MSLDLDRVNGLLNLVKEAAQHPAQLAPLGQLAMRELQGHAAEAKKEHDKILADEAKEAAAKKADADAKAKKIAEEDAKKAELISRPQPTAEQIKADRDAATVKQKVPDDAEAKRLADLEEQLRKDESKEVQADGTETVKRREIPQEEAHG